ncbi:MAG: integration host factor subunit alpha [Alphaproteobacteria bacterium]|nr:integration host factor subunit alpha [Alphaproteobacteria bacterium]
MFHQLPASGPGAASSKHDVNSSFAGLKRGIARPAYGCAGEDSRNIAESTAKARTGPRFSPNDCDHGSRELRKTLTRQDIVQVIVNRCKGIARGKAKSLVDDFIEEIIATLALGQTIKLRNFGSFNVRAKKSRPGRNPRTGAAALVLARKIVTFRAAPSLRAAVNGEALAKLSEKRANMSVRLIDLERRARFGRFDSGAPQHAIPMREFTDQRSTRRRTLSTQRQHSDGGHPTFSGGA